MDVEIQDLESDEPCLKKVKRNEEAMKPASEAGSSGFLNHDDDNDGDCMVDNEDETTSDYDDDGDYMFENFEEDDDEEADYLSMQAQFDNVDLPPGVEANVSWLKEPSAAAGTSNSALTTGNSALTTGKRSQEVEVPVPSNSKSTDIASSSSSARKEEEPNAEELKQKFEQFKRFDVVDDCSDHHFNSAGFRGQQPPRAWTKKIQDEWRTLEKGLPDTIFVRAYESRMDLLRAAIVGPPGTPYHDGLFVFDIHFPPTYPDVPPMVYYYSGGLRLNPNLYACGKVCLSLLNTWYGKGNETWLPKESTMLQVLVSIQALILNEKPFFNEPAHDKMYRGAEGEKKSKSYNESTFILSLKTMMYTLRRPPKHFEDLVAGHFRSRAHSILSACRAYMEGVVVGSIVDGKIPDGDHKSRSKEFKGSVSRMVNSLVSNFSRYGATDCDQYRV